MASSSYSMDSSAEYAPEMEAAAEEAGGVTSTSGIENVNTVSQKLIKTVSMSMETKEFDALLEDIRRQVEEMGGYIEDSDISGSSYYSTRGNRNAWLTLRIPAGKLEGFVTVVEELGNVVSKRESVEDITLRYVDVESHKKALETEQERLLELLERAENMEDIITIESRLSQVRYELQSYESALRTYDNQVNYSTVSLDISEVERVAELPEEKTFLEEVRYRLSDNLYELPSLSFALGGGDCGFHPPDPENCLEKTVLRNRQKAQERRAAGRRLRGKERTIKQFAGKRRNTGKFRLFHTFSDFFVLFILCKICYNKVSFHNRGIFDIFQKKYTAERIGTG